MPTDALSGHGTIIAYEQDPVGAQGVFTDIAELGDITPPGLMRNEFDATSQNRDIDTWVMGVLRREAMTFPVFFNQGLASHDVTTGLQAHIINNREAGFRVTFPESVVWIGSGFVRQVTPTNPVDGIQTAQITVRLSGPMIMDGVAVGS